MNGREKGFTLVELLVSGPLSPWERVRVRAKRTAADDAPNKRFDNFHRLALTPALSQGERGFTLVELLVVVTIIVVLLALLVPAMNKAIYQATLVKCAANYKMLATSSQFYAMDHKRYYPHRDLPKAPSAAPWPAGSPGIQPHKLTHPGESGSGVGNYDLRPMLRPYISINAVFNDPFCQPLNYDNREALSTTVSIYTSIFYWGGWYYTGRQGMFKLGDRFEAAEWPNKMRTYKLGVLAGDIDTREGSAYSSHPDMKEMFNRVSETPAWIESNWVWPGRADRAPLDLNFAYDDGAVLRSSRVEFEWESASEGMIRIFNFNTENGGGTHVPKP